MVTCSISVSAGARLVGLGKREEDWRGLERTSTRVCCLIKDVIELKNNNWVKRREDPHPKTIVQIHTDAKNEKMPPEPAETMSVWHSESNEIRRSGILLTVLFSTHLCFCGALKNRALLLKTKTLLLKDRVSNLKTRLCC